MNTPKYTFLLPAYKAKYFAAALESIKNQTYKEFICLVSDDCSPEDMKSIFDDVVGNDPRFTFRRNAENMGSKSLVSHWNLLVDMCDTEFLIMASDDDVYEPNFLEEINKLTEKYSEVDLFRARVQKIDENSLISKQEKHSRTYMDVLEFAHRLYSEDFLACISNYCYRTKRLKDKGLFIDLPTAWFSDDATNLMMASNGCVTTKNVAFSFRVSNINITGQWGRGQHYCTEKIEATLLFYNWMCKFMKSYEQHSLYEVVSKCWRYKVQCNIQNYIYHCKLYYLLKNIYRIPDDIGLNRVRILCHWFNSRLHIV